MAARLRALLAVAALHLGGCTGYPSEDTVPPNPFDIGNDERLQALDALGAKASRGERSRFALVDGCTLRVTRKGERFEQALTPGLHVGITSNKEDGVFEVHLLSDSSPDAERLGLLLRSSAWMQAAQADLLVQLMIRDCRPAPAVQRRAATHTASADSAKPASASGASRSPSMM